MAARTGLPPQRVAAWFTHADMGADDAAAVARAYGVPVDYLLDDPVPADIVEQLELLIALRDAGVAIAPRPPIER